MANPNLTPLQFLQKYQNLKVNYFPSEGGPAQQFTRINLRRYYINYRGPGVQDLKAQIEANMEDGLTKEEKRENKKLKKKISKAQQKDQMQKLVRKLKNNRSVDVRFTLQEVRYGKGLPEDYELFLGLAAAAGMCDVGEDGSPTRQSVQRFLDDSKIGIDCSGYASAFFAARGDISESAKGNVTREGAADWGSRRGNKKITRISDIRMGDCLVAVMANGKLRRKPGHIMLANGRGHAESERTMEFKPLNVHTGEGGEYMGETNGSVYICESRGGGLKHGPATFRNGYPNKRRPYFMIRRHGLSDWQKCIVVRPSFR